MKPQIKEEKTPVAAVPPPPLSALPGGFLKQLVRETEKETKQKEPETKDDKAVSGSLIALVSGPVRTMWFRSGLLGRGKPENTAPLCSCENLSQRFSELMMS